jgi:hypothetical protein
MRNPVGYLVAQPRPLEIHLRCAWGASVKRVLFVNEIA